MSVPAGGRIYCGPRPSPRAVDPVQLRDFGSERTTRGCAPPGAPARISRRSGRILTRSRVPGAGTSDASLRPMLARTMILLCLAMAACAMDVEGTDDDGDLDEIEASGLCDSTSGFISRPVGKPARRPGAGV